MGYIIRKHRKELLCIPNSIITMATKYARAAKAVNIETKLGNHPSRQ